MTGLHVRSWGTGERFAVLVHGMTTDSGSWCHTGPELAEQGYRVVAPDLPGHGRSGRGEYTLSNMADALIEAVPHAPAVAIGHSLGGLVLAAAVVRMKPGYAVYEDPPVGHVPRPSGHGIHCRPAKLDRRAVRRLPSALVRGLRSGEAAGALALGSSDHGHGARLSRLPCRTSRSPLTRGHR